MNKKAWGLTVLALASCPVFAAADIAGAVMPDGSVNVQAMIVQQFDANAAYAQCYDRIKGVRQCATSSDKFTESGCVERIYSKDNPEVLVSETTYMKGKKDGYELTYFEGGSLYKVMPYAKHKADGMSYEFNRSGHLVENVSYFEGMRHGPAQGYYDSGNLKYDANYALDRLEGLLRFYHDAPNKVQAHIIYSQGKRNGPAMFYDESGQLTYEVTFKDDKAISGKCASGRALKSAELQLVPATPPQCK